MKAVDIHPEDLIEKLCEGELNGAERQRLDAHLAQCSVCRFEIGVRADLERETSPLSQRPPLTRVGQRAPSPLPLAAGSLRSRSRRRWPLVLLAAAMVLCAGGATAAVLTGALPAPRWLSWSPVPNASGPAAPAGKNPASARKRAPKLGVSGPAVMPSAGSAELGAAPSPTPQPVLEAGEPAALTEARRAPTFARASARVARPAVDARAPEGPIAAAALTAPAPIPPSPAAGLFAEANQARRNGDVDRAVGLYQALQTQYAGSQESQLSRALLAQMLLDHGRPAAALSGFERYLAQDSPVLSAEALVGRARALEALGKLEEAGVAWQQVQSRFPGSVHARLAAARLLALGR